MEVVHRESALQDIFTWNSFFSNMESRKDYFQDENTIQYFFGVRRKVSLFSSSNREAQGFLFNIYWFLSGLLYFEPIKAPPKLTPHNKMG